ncbi:MAG TPA: hypothetical protein VKL40_14175 [Candidatus Angelobacter sp.]|nr:hypothetical protein [Candidatus Angelobacter sp.]
MRHWGIVITIAYILIVLCLLVPGATLILKGQASLLAPYTEWVTWIPIAIVVIGQALLLFLSVDTSWRRLKPRSHILVSCLVAGTLLALLTGAAIFSLGVGIWGDRFGGRFFDSGVNIVLCWGALWVAWLVVFYLYFRNSADVITRGTSWLLKGSILELLIAVPAHVVARRRDDCSAPVVTSFGIATGLAIMLLSFGPSVLLLYKKRLDQYANRAAAGKS